MKHNKILFVLILIIVFVLIIDAYLFYRTKIIPQDKNIQNNSNAVESFESEKVDAKQRIICRKQVDEFINNEINIKYKFEEEFTFYVKKNDEIIPDGYFVVTTFNNLKDWKTYDNYLDNINAKVSSKDEKMLTMSYYSVSTQDGYKYYDAEYLKYLNENGYICEEIIFTN